MKEYSASIDRAEKEKAYSMALRMIMGNWNGDHHFKCVILMPSVTCLDIDMFKPFFDENTKFIFIENFEYIHCTEREWKSTVLNHLPSYVKAENICFHCGEIEDLQLGAVLKTMGSECVDFAFFDLCGELTMKQYRWIWNNRCLFDVLATVMYTIDLQPSIINDCNCFDKRMKFDSTYDDHSNLTLVNDSDKMTSKVEQSAKCWSFLLKNLLNPSGISRCDSFIYRSGGNRHKMMIAKTYAINDPNYDYRHDYYEGFFRNSSSIDESLVEYDGIHWGDYGTTGQRKSGYEIRSNDILLFQNKDIVDWEFDSKRFLDYFFSGKDRRKPANSRRFRKDRILNCISACSYNNFPPELYESRYKSTRLYFAKCEQIYNECVLGKHFDYDGISIKFDKDYDILFCNSKRRYVKYIDNFDDALELYRQKNGSECGDVATKTLK